MAHSRAVVSMLSAVALLVAGAARAATTTSSTENPSVSFTTTGQKQITLQACNAKGCSTVTQMITVLDPRPVILTSLVGATTVEAGQLVNLVATAKGQPPLTYTWQVKNATGNVNVQGATLKISTFAPSNATLTINSVATTQGTCTFSNGPGAVSCTLGQINGGAQAVVTVSATPSAAAPANSWPSVAREVLRSGTSRRSHVVRNAETEMNAAVRKTG